MTNLSKDTIQVAQAISRLVDEAQEGILQVLPTGLYLNEDDEDDDRRITEVSAELTHGPNGRESFTVTTSDGRKYRVTVEAI